MSNHLSINFSLSINKLYYRKRDHICSNIDRDKIISMFADEVMVKMEYQNNLPIKKRIRLSKLDAHFHVIAEFMVSRSAKASRDETNDRYHLSSLIEIIKSKTGIVISKSGLSRYISSHPLIKEL